MSQRSKSPRLLFLACFALICAVVAVSRRSVPEPAWVDPPELPESHPLGYWELPGPDPQVPPQFSAHLEVDTSRGKNRLYYSISEKNGFYVETFDVRIWYAGETSIQDWRDAPMSILHRVEKYLKAGETLTGCIEVVPAELALIGGSLGDSADWAIKVEDYGRARVTDPQLFPPLGTTDPCH